MQSKLAVSRPDSAGEREAETTAARISAGQAVPAIAPLAATEARNAQPLHREPVTEQELVETAPLQRQAAEEEEALQTQALQRQATEEEEAVQTQELQRQPMEEEEEPVQAQALQRQAVEEEEAVQAQALQPQAMEEEEEAIQTKPVQRRSGGGITPNAGALVTHAASFEGRPMHEPTRSRLERSMGSSLADVRVHDDPAAQAAAQAVSARAYTQGRDIYLNRGESDADVSLMAHEATHVVQQTGGSVQRAMIQRSNGGGAAPGGTSGSVVDHAAKTISIPVLRLPRFKPSRNRDRFPTPLRLPRNYTRPTDQARVWQRDVATGIESHVDAKLENATPVVSATSKRRYYYLRSRRDEIYVFGTKADLVSKLTLPTFDRRGSRDSFDVDHVREMQLDGSNTPDNMELLDSAANQSAGRNIEREITGKVQDAIRPEVGGSVWPTMPKVRDVISSYDVSFRSVRGDLPVGGSPGRYWSRSDIKDEGKQLDPLVPLTAAQIERLNLRGSDTELVIFGSNRGGVARKIPFQGAANGTKSMNLRNWAPGFNLREVLYTPNDQDDKVVGAITGDAFRGNQVVQDASLTWEIRSLPGVGYGGYINERTVLQSIERNLKAAGLSPIRIDHAELRDSGIYAEGSILPTVPIIGDADIRIVIDGNDVELFKRFETGDFTVPRPIDIIGSDLEVFLGRRGIGARGGIEFGIERVGQGRFGAEISAGTEESGLRLEGHFDFDPNLFSQARIEAWYRQGEFGGGGRLRIDRGKIRGIRSAEVTATFGGGRVEANGTVVPDIRGIQEGTLRLTYSDEEGLVVGGTLTLSSDIPRIRSGSLEVEVAPRPEGEGYKLAARGTVVPDIPGISASLTAAYDDGAFDISGSVGYERGMLSGTVNVGVTNRPVGEDGRPSGQPESARAPLTLYGGGTLTLKLAPWLEATAGIRFLPNGEIEVVGRIGLPSALDLFEERRLDKNLFTIGLDIPVVGVSVLGQRIGIFVNISGGADIGAGIGPGQLRRLELSVTYNPDREEDTRVTGGAQLHVPASAGVRLFVRGALGAGIPVVSAQAGLEVGGRLGLEGALEAGVNVEWTPRAGLSIDAEAGLYAEPKFRFDITGFVLVEADLWLKTVELYEKRWELAAMEFGSGLRLGVRFPVRYREGTPFQLSLSDVQFDVPEIDPGRLLKDLVKRIA